MEVFLIKCWRRPTYFIVKKKKRLGCLQGQAWCKCLRMSMRSFIFLTSFPTSLCRSPISRLSELFLGVLLWCRSHSGSLFLLPLTSRTEPTSPSLTTLQSIFTSLGPRKFFFYLFFFNTFSPRPSPFSRYLFPLLFSSASRKRFSSQKTVLTLGGSGGNEKRCR